jgi:hypothetical protein
MIVPIPPAEAMSVIKEEAQDLGFLLELLVENIEKESKNDEIGCGSCSWMRFPISTAVAIGYSWLGGCF